MDDRTKLVRLPMKHIEGRWVLEYGGDLPIKHGAAGELVIEARLIEDSPEKNLFLKEERLRILPEGTPLRVLMEVRHPAAIAKEQETLLIPWEDVRPPCSPVIFPGPSQYYRAVEVVIGQPTPLQISNYSTKSGGLWLRTQGVTSIGLISSTIALPPCISEEPAQSLNHAYTLLSEVFEPWRRSHTGSVYRRVFYQESDEAWYPLGLLRDSHLAQQSHRIAHDLWKQMFDRYACPTR